jgi:hypothetical protein
MKHLKVGSQLGKDKNVMSCVFCRGILDIVAPVERKDSCPHCHRDLRCGSAVYDPNAYNECREVSAQWIIDKKEPIIDYFTLRGQGRQGP